MSAQKISEMQLSPQQEKELADKRKIARDQKRKSRAAKKEAELIAQPVTVDVAIAEFAVSHAYDLEFILDQGTQALMAQVSADLGRPLDDINEDYCVDFVARCLHGLKQGSRQDTKLGWIRKVETQDGVAELVSGKYFPDSPSEVIEYVNRLGLRKSQAFEAAYIELLGIIVRRYGRTTPISRDVQAAQAELNGTYELPQPRPKPEPEPKRRKKPDVPSDTLILDEGGIRTLEQIQTESYQPQARTYDPNMPLDALRYLEHGR